jgi:sugar/nucleoside kinase (ribokinase family)
MPGLKVRPVDTTGAGNAFVQGLLAGILEDCDPLPPERLTAVCRFAKAAGARATTKRRVSGTAYPCRSDGPYQGGFYFENP